MSIKNADTLLKDLWENRTMGLTTQPLDHINSSILSYLREQYPYLQMINMDAKLEETIIPKFNKSPSGWLVHDYGEAMSASPGPHLYGPGNPELEDDEGTTGSGGDDRGTLIHQTVVTANTMIEMAMEKGWTGVELVSGTNLMQWAAWIAAQAHSYPLTGYVPSAEGQRKWERIKGSQIITSDLFQKLKILKVNL